MTKGYEQLSRRGLIALNNEFDAENDEMLLRHLEKNFDSYEKVTKIEKATDAVLNATDSIKDLNPLKAIEEGVDKLLSTIVPQSVLEAAAVTDSEYVAEEQEQ